MINLEVPRRGSGVVKKAHQVAVEVFRPNSRRYDRAEHQYPRELDMLAAVINGANDSGNPVGGAGVVRKSGEDPNHDSSSAPAPTPSSTDPDGGVRNGFNLTTVLSVMELCWGDLGLLLSMPGQGLGNAAIASVASEEQLARLGSRWAAMAITEPSCGSDSAAITTSARLDGDVYVINGEKIFVTAGDRSDAVVVWATLDKSLGRAAIKPFLVEKGTPGFEVVRLEDKLGIRASDTATLRFEDCRVPRENLLGTPEIDVDRGFGGVMQTFDNTRPLVAAMACGVTRAALEETRSILREAGVEIDYDRPTALQPAPAAAFLEMEADYESSYLLTLRAAWMADNRQPNSMEASMAKAKAGRTATAVTLRCVALTGSVGYGEGNLLEKWARDAKILDIFEGTQQIQLLIVARRLLNKTSAQLR